MTPKQWRNISSRKVYSSQHQLVEISLRPNSRRLTQFPNNPILKRAKAFPKSYARIARLLKRSKKLKAWTCNQVQTSRARTSTFAQFGSIKSNKRMMSPKLKARSTNQKKTPKKFRMLRRLQLGKSRNWLWTSWASHGMATRKSSRPKA